MNTLELPELSLVVLIGPSSSGKTTFARRHFAPTEILSSDFCRGLVSDDENDQEVTEQAFEVLRLIVQKRLELGKLTVIDATNLRPEDRKPLIVLARDHHFLPAALVFAVPEKTCQSRNETRGDRRLSRHVLRAQCRSVRRAKPKQLKREGFRTIHILDPELDLEAVEIVRRRMWNDRRDETGPFDIIGDVHGCFDELHELLGELGWRVTATDEEGRRCYRAEHPGGRRLIFLGDLVDRGPRSNEVLRLVMDLVQQGVAHCVPGNHEVKLRKALIGKKVQVKHGLAETLEQLEPEGEAFKQRVSDFIHGLVSHLVLDCGRLVVAHAGLKELMQGRGSRAVRDFCTYGDTTGETDEYGLPIRYPWAEDYRGKAMVVYGHTPVPEAEWLNRTICIDTGCVFGGSLTALRYPEREIVSVDARSVYYEPAKPLRPEVEPSLQAQHETDRLLDIDDVLGKRLVRTRFGRHVTVREENAAAALEVMSRFSVDPRWLIYLPPTMAPSSTSGKEGYLEHPERALDDYWKTKVERVVAQEKHMGSRATLVVCRDEDVVRDRFGMRNEGIGVVYTRTGRPFFRDRELGQALLQKVGTALTRAGLWEELETDWLCLDAEILPWSAKAQDLLLGQYGSVAAAGEAGLARSIEALESAARRGADVGETLERFRRRAEQVQLFRKAYRPYCWDVSGLADYRIAPFHLLASEGRVHDDKDHLWHMRMLARLAEQDDLLIATPHREVRLDSGEDCRALVDWWEELTGAGGEGLVLKPLDFVSRDRRGMRQPALKCRGAEYLRIIYGPEYREEQRLESLRGRGLSRKRSLALREFSLGLEALHRFVEREPLRHVHECVFAVLALESEPVDPRL